MKLSHFTKADKRRTFLEKEIGTRLDAVKKVFIDEESYVHCENLIGGVSIPLGVAGPLKIKGESIKGNFYIPLATTEGALIASVSRGCKALNEAGGALVRQKSVGATRGPVFITSGIDESLNFDKWLYENLDLLKVTAEKTSSRLSLMEFKTTITGDRVFVRFYFNTQDAMGMNMVTIATEKLVELIEEKAKIKCISLAGNFDIDKKPGWLNFILGRGKRVWAEIILSEKTVVKILKTTYQEIYDVWLSKCLMGSAVSGSLGFNAHFANVIAAFFAATGQDLAHVVEGSLGITTTKIVNRGLYVSIYMPALMIGTVGGGANLKTQEEAKKIMGVKSKDQLTEVLAGAVLAGEISLLASLAEGSLVKAHKKLGR